MPAVFETSPRTSAAVWILTLAAVHRASLGNFDAVLDVYTEVVTMHADAVKLPSFAEAVSGWRARAHSDHVWAVFFGCGRAARSLQGLTHRTTRNQPRRRWTRSKHPDKISCERPRASRWARRPAGSARCAGAISVPAHSPRTASSARRRPASSTAASATASTTAGASSSTR
jgi:hypothetical protein